MSQLITDSPKHALVPSPYSVRTRAAANHHRVLHVHLPNVVVPRYQTKNTLVTNVETESTILRSRFGNVGNGYRENQRDPRCGVILFDPFRLLVLLVLNAVKHNNDPAKWSFPKGLQEYPESPEKCALRELSEETGFSLSIRYLRQHGRKMMIHQNTYFNLLVDSTKIRLEPKDTKEIERAEFIHLDKLATLACNCDLRRWRDQEFKNLLPYQGEILSIWGQSPLRFKIFTYMDESTTVIPEETTTEPNVSDDQTSSSSCYSSSPPIAL